MMRDFSLGAPPSSLCRQNIKAKQRREHITFETTFDGWLMNFSSRPDTNAQKKNVGAFIRLCFTILLTAM